MRLPFTIAELSFMHQKGLQWTFFP